MALPRAPGTSALPILSFPPTPGPSNAKPECNPRTSSDGIYLLSNQDKQLISDLKECINVKMYDTECKESILNKRKQIGDGIIAFLTSKFSTLFCPLPITSTASIFGVSTDPCKGFEECFQERFILFDLLIFMVRTGHQYAASIREDSVSSDPLSIIDLEGKDSENSWRTMFILLLFDLFFEDEETDMDKAHVGTNSQTKSVLVQMLKRLSCVEDALLKDDLPSNLAPSADANIKSSLNIERLYLVELIFHCCSKFIPLNMSEWDTLLSTISTSISNITEENPFVRGLFLFSIVNGLAFHSPYKPMYDLVRSRLPHRQDYFSSKQLWESWLRKMEDWISTHLWADVLFKHCFSLGFALFLRMSREVRTLKGGLSPSLKETSSYMGAIDSESSVPDSFAIEGIQGEKSLLSPKTPRSLFVMLTEKFLPSTLDISGVSPWGYDSQISESAVVVSKWEGYVCESLMLLSTSILTWGSFDWIRGGKQQNQTVNVLASFCDMIGAIFSYSALPIYSPADRRKPFLDIDASVESFWESEKATFFIRSTLSSVGSSSPELSSSALRMLIGLAHGPISSIYAFDLLQRTSEYSSSVLTWNNLFSALERYHVTLALESGDLSPSETAAIELMFALLQTICKYQPSCITKLLVGDISDTASPFLFTLFGIISSHVPTTIKAQILILLSEWMRSATEGPSNASLLWAHLEASQIIPTLAMDSMTTSSNSIEEDLASPLPVTLGGILQEFYQIEAPVGTYPVTYSLLHLISCLVGQRKIDSSLVLSLSSSLGVGSRKFPGLWPYIKFVLSGALIPICTGPSFRLSFLYADEKMAMVGKCVSIITDILELNVIPSFYSILNATGLLSIFFAIGTIHGEVLGLPSLDIWSTPSIEESLKPLIIADCQRHPDMVSLDMLQFLFTQLKASKSRSSTPTTAQLSYSEETIIIVRPHFLSILAQIISTNKTLDLVLVSIDLLRELLLVPKVESILRSVLGSEGMEKFSMGIARWFGDILLIEDDTETGSQVTTKVSIIRENILLLLASQIEDIPVLSTQRAVSPIQININTTALLLGLHRPEEETTLLLIRLVSSLLQGDFSSSSLLHAICKSWGKSEMLRNAGGDPHLILQAIDKAFASDHGSLPLLLTKISDALHLVAWMVRDPHGETDPLFRSGDTLHNILSQLLSIVPANNLISLTTANEGSRPAADSKRQQIHDFLQGHSNALAGISLLLPEPTSAISELIVDALVERGTSWSISIVDTLADILSRCDFNDCCNGNFFKLCSLFPSIAPRSTSDFAVGRIFTALNLALFKESISLSLPSSAIDGLSHAISENFSSNNYIEACRLACTILLDSRNIPAVEQISTSLRRLLSVPSKLEELIRESLFRSEKKDETVFIEFICCLFSVFKDDPQVLTCMVQLLASSGYPSHIHDLFKNSPTCLQFIPLLEVASYMIEFSSLAGASVSTTLRSCIGQLLSVPLERQPDKETYSLIISLRMATNIVKGISMLPQSSAADLKMISSLHEKAINILLWFSAQSSSLTLQVINREEIDARVNILDLLVVLVSYFLSAHRIFTLNDSFSELLSEGGGKLQVHNILIGALFRPSLDSGLAGNKRAPGLGTLFSLIDIFYANITTAPNAICGMEQVLMIIWFTLGSLYSYSSAIPASFFSDLHETLSPKLYSILSISKERGLISSSLQYSTSLANEIKQQFLCKY